MEELDHEYPVSLVDEGVAILIDRNGKFDDFLDWTNEFPAPLPSEISRPASVISSFGFGAESASLSAFGGFEAFPAPSPLDFGSRAGSDEIVVYLQETSTDFLLDLSGTAVLVNSAEGVAVVGRNETYLKALERKKKYPERFKDHWTETREEWRKPKSTQTSAIRRQSIVCQATSWDMFDEFMALQEYLRSSPSEKLTMFSSLLPENEENGSSRLSELTESASSQRAQSVASISSSSALPPDEELLHPVRLVELLLITERYVSLNQFWIQLGVYRDRWTRKELKLDPVIFPGSGILWEARFKSKRSGLSEYSLPSLEFLWSFECETTTRPVDCALPTKPRSSKSRSVTDVAHNTANPHLLVASYCHPEFDEYEPGLVCAWTVKNPRDPERCYVTRSGALSVDFSRDQPNILAVGLYSGAVALYDVASTSVSPMHDELGGHLSHSGPVWQVAWVPMPAISISETGKSTVREHLLSVAEDGLVIQWHYVKGRKTLEGTSLIKLKRRWTCSHSMNVIPLTTDNIAGFCFALSQVAGGTLIVGTYTGEIRAFDIVKPDRISKIFEAHTRCVYRLKWNPFVSKVFMTCAEDWTVKIWHLDYAKALVDIDVQKPVIGCDWSKVCSTTFGLITKDGPQIWDIKADLLRPIVSLPSLERGHFSCIAFAPTNNCLVLGDVCGRIHVFKLRNLTKAHADQEKALIDVLKTTPTWEA
ncbi:unnamed protein product [Notodromas monacha]|uniref:Dynein axonemal intermediate chain 4 n=1 Tax=Notodromas monacha TaxID=399045 RepID=A0A7R9BGH0_9CRUS|nr:unnamed protein product [Notodromas monacha]CAG0913727.1 unnamed protein product [Notodromas monacha]